MIEDVSWVRLRYPDDSERILRATTNVDVILLLTKNLPNRDVYCSNGFIKEGYIFDVKNLALVDISDCELEIFNKKPEFSREVDKYANSFI